MNELTRAGRPPEIIMLRALEFEAFQPKNVLQANHVAYFHKTSSKQSKMDKQSQPPSMNLVYALQATQDSS